MRVEVCTGERFEGPSKRRVPTVIIQIGGVRYVTDAPDDKAAFRMAEQAASALGLSK
jgi:hypothetical protein